MPPHAISTGLALAITLTSACSFDDIEIDTLGDSGDGDSSGGDSETSGAPPTMLHCASACEIHAACADEPIDGCVGVCESMSLAYSLLDEPCELAFALLTECVSEMTCEGYALYDAGEHPLCSFLPDELDSCSGPSCRDYCANAIACGIEDGIETCEQNCATSIVGGASRGEFCVTAKHSRFECAADLECGDLVAWDAGETNPCGEYDLAKLVVCKE